MILNGIIHGILRAAALFSHGCCCVHMQHSLFLKSMKNLSSVTLRFFSGTEIKIMITEKNIAFTCVLKKNSNLAAEKDRKNIVPI